jgi:hypothetical protein
MATTTEVKLAERFRQARESADPEQLTELEDYLRALEVELTAALAELRD